MMLGRKKARAKLTEDEAPEADGAAGPDDATGAEDSAETAGGTAPQSPYDRTGGPFDADEVDDPEPSLDFGAVRVPRIAGLTIRLEADPRTQSPMALTLAIGSGAVQVRAFAAPRSGGLWHINRQAMAQTLAKSGAAAQEAEGPFGPELVVDGPAPAAGGPGGRQRMRYVGVDGPRWLLTGAFLAQGDAPPDWSQLEGVFCSLIVVRGEQAMPVGALLPLSPPAQAVQPAADARPTEESLEPGARITEVR